MVIDPRPGQKHAYAVTINAIVGTTPATVSNPTGSCILGKSLSVFTWNDPMSRWDLMDGNQILPSNSSTSAPPTVWLTDPALAVGPDGTLYLSALRSQAGTSCTADMSQQNTVDLWFAPPGQALQPYITVDGSGNPLPYPDLVVPPANLVDHPKVAVSASGTPVVTWVIAQTGAQPDQAVAVLRQPAGSGMAGVLKSVPQPIPAISFPNPVFVNNRLYLALTTIAGPAVRAYDWTGTDWTDPHLSQSLTVNDTYAMNPMGTDKIPLGNINVPSSGGGTVTSEIDFREDPTPAIAAGILGNSAKPAVYVAYEVGSGPFAIDIQAANFDSGQAFAPFIHVPSPAGLSLFHPALALDAANDLLDLVAYAVKPGDGTVAGQKVGVYLFQFDASSGAQIGAATELNPSSEWTVGGLPSREGGLDNGHALWPPGEYVGLSAVGQSAMAIYPVNAGSSSLTSTVTQVATITAGCMTSAFQVSDNGDLWECSNCNCGGVTTAVSGCVSPFVTSDDVVGGPKAACTALCPTAGCGGSLSCPVTSTCVAPPNAQAQGHLIAGSSCDLNEIDFGAPPTNTADYVATDNGSSFGQLVLNGTATTTPSPGSVSLNASSNPPQANAGVEISRVRLTPASFHAGGILSGTVSNIVIQNATRLRGTFNDSQHFTIPTGAAKFVVGVTDQPDGTSTATNLELIAWNPSPLVGSLNPATNAVTLQGSASDGVGNTIAVNFSGVLTQKLPPCPDPNNVTGGLLGFESLDWSTNGSPILGLVNSPTTEGCHALSVSGQGYIAITGPQFNTTQLTSVGPAISLDVFVPPSQPNPSYFGAVQLYLSCPSANFWSQFIGQAELTGLPTNRYSTLRFPLPAQISAMLQGTHPDCFFNVNLNINQAPTPLLLDNLRSTP